MATKNRLQQPPLHDLAVALAQQRATHAAGACVFLDGVRADLKELASLVMPHRLIGRESQVIDEIVDVGGAGARPLLRAHRLATGDAAVLTTDDATRDGTPVIGGVSVVAWGAGAIFRTSGERFAIGWDAASERIVAPAGDSCRLCFGTFGVVEDEAAIACARCAVPFHCECHALAITCPGCGAATGGGAT